MESRVTKLSCDKLAQQISLKKVKGNWCVELKDIKNLLLSKSETVIFECDSYNKAINRYVSLVEEQARHIALISL